MNADVTDRPPPLALEGAEQPARREDDVSNQPPEAPAMRTVDIWHNIMWSRYKAAIFSALHNLVPANGIGRVRVFQIAESEGNRTTLSGVDYGAHDYDYELLFKGLLEDVPQSARIRALAKRVWRSDADLIILCGFHRPEYWFQLLVGRLKGKKMAMFCDSTAYDNPPSLLKNIAKTVIFRSCHAIFCYGRRSREYVLSFGASPGRIFQRVQACVLPPGYTEASAIAARLATGGHREPHYLYVGRLSAEKDIPTLLEAFARVRRTQPGARLTIVGQGPEREALAARCAQLRVADKVEFTGGLSGPGLYAWYSRATCLVLPSMSEPWGLVVNEALSFGCPVIVSHRCGCVPELVVDQRTGYVFQAGDVEDLAEKMRSALTVFADREVAAESCLQQIAPYTPGAAAAQILYGCSVVLDS